MIDLAEQACLDSEEVEPDKVLETAFERIWKEHIADPDFRMNMGTPFYHMRSEPFWQLKIDCRSGIDIEDKHKMKHLATQRKVSARAVLDTGLLGCLRNGKEREILRQFLIKRYFHSENDIGGQDKTDA